MKIYKLEFEVVSPFPSGGMRFYTGDKPNTPPSEIPDKFWQKVSKEDASPFDQYNQLKKWVDEGVELIRNVCLFEQDVQPANWKPSAYEKA